MSATTSLLTLPASRSVAPSVSPFDQPSHLTAHSPRRPSPQSPASPPSTPLAVRTTPRRSEPTRHRVPDHVPNSRQHAPRSHSLSPIRKTLGQWWCQRMSHPLQRVARLPRMATVCGIQNPVSSRVCGFDSHLRHFFLNALKALACLGFLRFWAVIFQVVGCDRQSFGGCQPMLTHRHRAVIRVGWLSCKATIVSRRPASKASRSNDASTTAMARSKSASDGIGSNGNHRTAASRDIRRAGLKLTD